MQRAFDKFDRQEIHVESDWTVGVTVACWALVLTFVALTSNYPTVSNWVSDAAKAEFDDAVTPALPPVQIAQPAGKIQTVRVY